MKLHRCPITSRLLCLAAAALGACCSSGAAGAPEGPVMVVRGRRAASDPHSNPIQRGSSRRDVESRIGLPPDRLSQDVWVYWNFTTIDERVDSRDCDTLLVTFVEDRVVNLRLVPGQPVLQFLAQQRQRLHERPAALLAR